MRGGVVWLTGLSGAGKTTLARGLERRLAGRALEVLDGDELRKTLCAGLGYSRADRDANVRRIGFVAGLLARHGVVAVVAAISPYRQTRDEVLSAAARKLEVFVDCPLEVCAARDPKGLYAAALRGEIPHFTGVGDPYEPPLAPDLHLRTDQQGAEACVGLIAARLEAGGWL